MEELKFRDIKIINSEIGNREIHKLKIINCLDEKGYKHKEKIIDNEEYIIITNGISSCAIQVEGDRYLLYEIIYDFGINRYFLLYRNDNEIDNLERMFIGINFLIRDISFNYLKASYGLKDIKNEELKVIKEILINNGFLIFELNNIGDYILFSKNGKKWGAIEHKNNKYVYSYVYVTSKNELFLGSSEIEKEFNLNNAIMMIENSYEKDLDIY